MQYDEWPPREADAPRPSRMRRVFTGCLSITLVLSLLASAVISAAFLWSQWRTRPAPPPTASAQAGTAAPEMASGATATATPPPATPATAPATAAAPAPVGDPNRIAFVNRAGQLETIAPDGSSRRQLTDADARFQFPAWSPDGQNVAAIGSGRSGGGIYVLPDQAGGPSLEPRYLSRLASPFYLYWSPDSRHISFLANDAEADIALYLTALDEGEESRLLATGAPFYWQWMADSRQILIHSGANGEGSRLAVIDADGQEIIGDIGSPGIFQAPAVSADGRYWAFAASQPDGQSWLTILDRETGREQTQRHGGAAAMAWSPTANRLAVISGPPDTVRFHGPLWLWDAGSTSGRLLSRETALAFFWSPDGRYLAYLTASRFSEDVQVRRESSRLVRVADAAGPQPAAQTTPVSFQLRLVEVATGEERQLASFQPTAVFITQFLPFFDQYALSHRIWSPDSTALVLPVRRDSQNQVTIFPLDGGAPREVARGDMPFWSHR